ncbi:MAG: hypothetical protein IJX92_01695 [Clostridia bacterium]|nr:hypothetical protein [Clostridia bacterium]
MDSSAMELFLSKDNISKHREYTETLRCKHSVMEKSIPEIAGKTPLEIYRMSLKRSVKCEILPLLINYHSHLTFFDSFAKNDVRHPAIKRYFSSEDDFCYRALEYAKGIEYGFLYVYKDRRGNIKFASSGENNGMYLTTMPLLALDVCEHAYFADYGYRKEEYLKAAVARLDIAKLLSE